jgi:hypothetical protein
VERAAHVGAVARHQAQEAAVYAYDAQAMTGDRDLATAFLSWIDLD